MDLGSELFEMIDRVSQATDERSASSALLIPLIKILDMDQGAYCELAEGEVTSLFAVDRTHRILQGGQSLWLSRTLVLKALRSMSPEIHVSDVASEGGVPKSVDEFSLRNVVCIPVSRNPDRVVYLASQRDPLRRFSAEELTRFKVATRAAALALQQHRAFHELRESNQKLRASAQARKNVFLCADPAMTLLLAEVARIAPFNVSVLIQGESGSGKEELAREIHRQSGRKGAFVAVNCANLTETLLESELFGYARGAFTGATNAKRGLLQEAEGGTFLLDEISELSFTLQAKLLRVLQERTIRPVGSTQDIPIDVRILAATHTDLKLAVEERKFREDLYYRIQEMTVYLPSLRERPADIELVSHHFVRQFSAEFQLPERKLSAEALAKLQNYPFPGNLRELKNVCRTAVILSRTPTVEPEHLRLAQFGSLPPAHAPRPALHLAPETPVGSPVPVSLTGALNGPTNGSLSLRKLTQDYERELILRLLKEPGQTQAEVAQRLDISVRTLQRILSPPAAAEI